MCECVCARGYGSDSELGRRRQRDVDIMVCFGRSSFWYSSLCPYISFSLPPPPLPLPLASVGSSFGAAFGANSISRLRCGSCRRKVKPPPKSQLAMASYCFICCCRYCCQYEDSHRANTRVCVCVRAGVCSCVCMSRKLSCAGFRALWHVCERGLPISDMSSTDTYPPIGRRRKHATPREQESGREGMGAGGLRAVDTGEFIVCRSQLDDALPEYLTHEPAGRSEEGKAEAGDAREGSAATSKEEGEGMAPVHGRGRDSRAGSGEGESGQSVMGEGEGGGCMEDPFELAPPDIDTKRLHRAVRLDEMGLYSTRARYSRGKVACLLIFSPRGSRRCLSRRNPASDLTLCAAPLCLTALWRAPHRPCQDFGILRIG